MNEIVFTTAKLNRFIQAYEEAKEAGEDTFVYEGHVILVSYAKYLIEHLKTKLA